ncbi:hypothetical protein LXL04_034219 [Taraxacum kok-saghyz]
MEFGGRKRGRQDGGWNGAPKRPRDEMESFTPGVGSKSKPCTKFFSTSGCPFGEGCHFLHYVHGGTGPTPSPSPTMGRKPGPPFGDTPIKSKLCNKMNTPEGCKFGDKCRFAHSQMEVNNNNNNNSKQQGFGESATAKISIDGSLAGPIIGKGGVNSKQICRVTGVKLAIRDHESDGSKKNIELEGSFDQIKHASAMVHDLILNIAAAAPPTTRGGGGGGGGGGFQQQGYGGGGGGNKIKTKMCENFVKGQCTFGDRCHFAHGQNELRR